MRTRTSLATILLIAGALALLLALPALPAPLAAAPLLALTETVEPTVVTATPQPTATQPPAATPEPTATQPAIDTPQPTATPEGDTPQPTATPEDNGEGRHADPAVSKSASTGAARVGDSITFTITVTNGGDGDARDVLVEDNLPGFLELVSAQATRGDVQTTPRSVRLFLGRVSPGDEVVMQVVTRVIAPATAPDNRNVVTLTTPSGGDNPANNQSSAAVLISSEALVPTLEAPTATAEAPAAVVELPTPTVEAPAAASVAARPAAAGGATPVEPTNLPQTAGAVPWGAAPAVIVFGLVMLGLGSALTQRRRRRK